MLSLLTLQFTFVQTGSSWTQFSLSFDFFPLKKYIVMTVCLAFSLLQVLRLVLLAKILCQETRTIDFMDHKRKNMSSSFTLPSPVFLWWEDKVCLCLPPLILLSFSSHSLFILLLFSSHSVCFSRYEDISDERRENSELEMRIEMQGRCRFLTISVHNVNRYFVRETRNGLEAKSKSIPFFTSSSKKSK